MNRLQPADIRAITILQEHGSLTGRELRHLMGSGQSWFFRHITNSLAMFYGRMAELADAELVKVWDARNLLGGTVIETRRFSLTTAGKFLACGIMNSRLVNRDMTERLLKRISEKPELLAEITNRLLNDAIVECDDDGN